MKIVQAGSDSGSRRKSVQPAGLFAPREFRFHSR